MAAGLITGFARVCAPRSTTYADRHPKPRPDVQPWCIPICPAFDSKKPDRPPSVACWNCRSASHAPHTRANYGQPDGLRPVIDHRHPSRRHCPIGITRPSHQGKLWSARSAPLLPSPLPDRHSDAPLPPPVSPYRSTHRITEAPNRAPKLY
jgi:hypothetical protein